MRDSALKLSPRSLTSKDMPIVGNELMRDSALKLIKRGPAHSPEKRVGNELMRDSALKLLRGERLLALLLELEMSSCATAL